VDALRAATVLPARYFGLPDRGAVEPGLRADLVLVAGDPVTDISATRRIERIWCGGTERRPDRAGE
jgi:imidazolonepropionase-like amidohydrolase